MSNPPVTILDAHRLDPGFLESDNPRSLLNIAPEELKPFLTRLPPDMFLMREEKLKKKANPDFTSKCLRIQFWQEYARAQNKRTNMDMTKIVAGVTHKQYFLHLAATRSYELAWICIPPKDYAVTQEEILQESLEKVRQAVRADFYDTKITEKTDANGKKTKVIERKINASAIAELRKITESLQDRVLGSLTKQIAVSHTVNSQNAPGILAVDALSQIEEELETLEVEFEERPIEPTRYSGKHDPKPIKIDDSEWVDEDLDENA